MPPTPTLYVVHHDRTLHLGLYPIAQRLGALFLTYIEGGDFLRSYRPGECDCIITDFHLLDMTGLELQTTIRQRSSSTTLLFLSDTPSVGEVVQAMKQGAIDVLPRNVSESRLHETIASAFEKATQSNRLDQAHTEQQERFHCLTSKEREVLNLMLAGAPNKVIAKRFTISLRTVEVRRQQIFRKTQTKSLAELVRLAIKAASDS